MIISNLRVSPRRVDSWAALGLIYCSQLEQILNLTDLKTERVTPDAVTRCLRCFAFALRLAPETVTLLIERGCLAYQLHSYAARFVKKSRYRSYPESFVNLCHIWRLQMLMLARESYLSALRCEGFRVRDLLLTVEARMGWTRARIQSQDSANQSSKGQEHAKTQLIWSTEDADDEKKQDEEEGEDEWLNYHPEEEWLCFYMLAKCAEKAGPAWGFGLVGEAKRALASGVHQTGCLTGLSRKRQASAAQRLQLTRKQEPAASTNVYFMPSPGLTAAEAIEAASRHAPLSSPLHCLGPSRLKKDGESYWTVEDDWGGETIGEWVMRVLGHYRRAADALDAAGAKYPKKIVLYHKLPFRAVEAVENSPAILQYN
ncbi:unnamed protein product [Protopolystoma xenopodis]|uniref:Uncharacterized protein n=1 Tax=Protopolystoma xenopodis TaxID=117903 RepID=A0A3S5CLZ2_9PLAT|nr:unnamed protein product [Protopolystoma xenopodis]